METFREDAERLKDRGENQTPRKLKQRRFLICRGNHTNTWIDPIMIWVDDDDSCARVPPPPERPHHLVDINTGTLYPTLFHVYNVGGRTAIRCPLSIEDSERPRLLTDIPEGSGAARGQEWIRQHGRTKPKPKPPEDDEPRRITNEDLR